MKKKKSFSIFDRCIDIAPVFFLAGISMCALFLFLGELIYPDERDALDSYYRELDSVWYQEFEDGTRAEVDVPGKVAAQKGEVVTFVTTVPKDVENGTYVCFRPIWQDMSIYVGDELREVHNSENTRPFGKNSAFRYVFVRLTQEDAEKELRCELVSDSKYSGSIRQVYYGEKSSIWMHLVTDVGAKAIAALTLGIMGLFSIVVCFVLRFIVKRPLELRFLAWAIFLCAWWMFSEIEFRQLFVRNVSVWTYTTYWSLMLMAFPVLLYINEMQKGRYKKIYGVALIYSALVFVIGTVLQVFDIVQFVTQLPFIHLGLGASIFIVIVTLTVDTFTGRMKEYMLVGVGIYGMLLSAILEMVLYYLQAGLSIGTVLAVGLMFLLVMATVKAGKDFLLTEKKKQEAVIAREAQAKFLANMSHEIRTPINAVIGMNEMILRENQDDTIREYAQNVQRASSMLLELVNDILDFTKIESGQLEIIESEYYLGNILHDEKLLLETRIGNKPIDMKVDVDSNIPAKLCGDEVRIKQILTNILSNAAKYTERGTIEVGISFKWLTEEMISLGFRIQDSGIGIREDELPALFDEFKRLDLNKNHNVEGTGLGLNIVKQLVNLMQGEIRVESEYGKGTTFYVWIPQRVVDKRILGDYEQAVYSEYEKEQPRSSFTAPKASVLVVDDNVMNLNLMKALLKRTQIKVDTARSGMECLKYARQKKYHLILMDHMMPEMDGVETLHKLRMEEDTASKDAIVIALTANAVAGCREMYIGYGFNDYFTKPIQAVKLEELLIRYLPKELVAVVQGKEETTEVKSKPEVEKASQELLAIDRALGLSYCMDTEELYQEMLAEFCKQMETYLPQLDAYVTTEDWSQYGFITHAIKSNALNIGATNFAALSREHERAGREQDAAFIHAEYPVYKETLKALIKQIRE